MIKKDVFTIDYIKKIQTNSKRDPGLIERVIYAFGLLESLVIAETPFIFKGGTSLMLLLDRGRRFSTDIDIIVEPGTPIDVYIQRASEIFPFVRFEEQRRGKKNDIDKRHFKFYYESPVNKKDFHIILDVVFQRNPYADLKTCKIDSDLIEVEVPEIFVRLPSANCIIADKLTAFAPHTTGIPFDKEMEIIKQLYDIASLFDVVDDFSMVKQTYREIAELELGYRGLEKLSYEDVLLDIIRAAKCIISKGRSDKDEHHHYIRGINNIKNHIYSENYSENSAIFQACKVLYLAASILTDQAQISVLRSSESFASIDGKQLSYIKKLNEEANAYLIEGLRLIS